MSRPPGHPRSGLTVCLLAALLLALRAATAGAADAAAPSQDTSAGRPAPAPLPQTVDLRPAFREWTLSPRRQGGRPTCSVFTVAGALEYAAAKREGHGTRLSVEFLNWAANAVRGETNDGGFFSDLWRGFAAYGIAAEKDMPYQPQFDPAQSPSAATLADARTRLDLGLRLHWIKRWNVHTGLTDEHLTHIKRTLSQGWPVCGGFRWPKQEQWTNDVLQMCPSNAVRDGHSVLLVGYRDDATQPGGGVFLFRNTARNGRDGYMSFTYAQAYMNDAVWVDFGARTNSRASASHELPNGDGPVHGAETCADPERRTGQPPLQPPVLQPEGRGPVAVRASLLPAPAAPGRAAAQTAEERSVYGADLVTGRVPATSFTRRRSPASAS